MWYLLLVFVTSSGVTSQQIPVENQAKCIEKLAVFDNAELKIASIAIENPHVRAMCIEGISK